MSRISKIVKENISGPTEENGMNYGSWYLLPRETKRLISTLVNECEIFEEAADRFCLENIVLKEQIKNLKMDESKARETDEKIINIGDICIYHYNTANKSLCIVEVVNELSDEAVEVKFHQVIFDDSGNDLFTYLCDNDKTMNVSKKFLHKIFLINRQKAEIEMLKRDSEEFFEKVKLALTTM